MNKMLRIKKRFTPSKIPASLKPIFELAEEKEESCIFQAYTGADGNKYIKGLYIPKSKYKVVSRYLKKLWNEAEDLI